MSVNNFIPVVWTSKILLNLHKAQVWGQPGIVNTDYAGDIMEIGNTVRIGAIGPIAVKSYSKNTLIGVPDTLTDASTTLTIDQGDFFNFAIDDVDKMQANVSIMNAALYEAAYAISNKADIFLSGLVSSVAASNVIGTDAAPQTDTAPSSGFSKMYDYLVDLGVLLKKANAWFDQNMWVIVPPFAHGLLQRDDRFVKYGTPAQNEALFNGTVGFAAGFRVLVSNNILLTGASSNVYNITAGSPMAISYADQITETVAYRPEQRFADALKGLHVYGAKVVRPQALAVLKATDPGF